MPQTCTDSLHYLATVALYHHDTLNVFDHIDIFNHIVG